MRNTWLICDKVRSSVNRMVLPNSVAVLPFENLSPKPDDAYFASGLHQEVIDQLSKIHSMSVIARSSVMQYANAPKPVPEVARDLHVGSVMEGSVRFANSLGKQRRHQ